MVAIKNEDEFQMMPPLKTKLFDPKQRTLLGRDSASWAKIGLFYLIFYGMLAALVAICMWVFFQTLDPRIPKWQLDRSIIGTNPGLGFRPMSMENAESTLIWIQGANKTNYEKWKSSLNSFLDKYYTPGMTEKGTASVRKCSYTQPPQKGHVCDVDVKVWKECNRDQHYNYHKNSPCIFLKLNKIYGWIPEYYNTTNGLPQDMPPELKKRIVDAKPEERNTVWVSCEGENPADVEAVGPIQYFPDIQGFPGYYYPYENAEGYLSPLVAVHFLRPKSGIVINIECKAWARNIKHSRVDRIGSVHFELLID
ncbi:sodium/potassium-transporting ATPase subunit beta-2-like isoform X2 [Onthophagus taurus]|uniref:sodium/potassium-transporting ATPase subunit beta-2-like isoform X2 n=1 Tax=Onthophagus taurus TaxID=166361 RepID=UPI000C20586F|nr:sodium/potassium-transporting ATPase subunit beta-2-like isoform X2 [Onthophagus taurus]